MRRSGTMVENFEGRLCTPAAAGTEWLRRKFFLDSFLCFFLYPSQHGAATRSARMPSPRALPLRRLCLLCLLPLASGLLDLYDDTFEERIEAEPVLLCVDTAVLSVRATRTGLLRTVRS